MKVDTLLRIVCAMQINAMLFGAGAVAVLSLPQLSAHATVLIPAVVVLAFGISPFLAGFVARRMRLRNWSRYGWTHGDLISG